MAITHIRISTLPLLVDCKKNDVAVVLNASHLIVGEDEFSIDNNSGYKGENLDKIGYQVSEDEINWSNEAFVSVNYYVNTNTPESVNDILAAAENTNYNLETESLLGINASTDRIKITGISGFGLPTYNGQPLAVGMEIFWKDFSLLEFDTNDGGLSPYAIIYYQAGNHLGYNEATIYTVTINVATLAEIAFISRNLISYAPQHNYIDDYEISKGIINVQAKVNIDIAGDLFTDSPTSKVYIKYDNTVLTKTANENFDIFVDIGTNGKANIVVEHEIIDVTGAGSTTSTVTLVLEEVDGQTSNVSGTDTVISTVNFNHSVS